MRTCEYVIYAASQSQGAESRDGLKAVRPPTPPQIMLYTPCGTDYGGTFAAEIGTTDDDSPTRVHGSRLSGEVVIAMVNIRKQKSVYTGLRYRIISPAEAQTFSVIRQRGEPSQFLIVLQHLQLLRQRTQHQLDATIASQRVYDQEPEDIASALNLRPQSLR